jgi:hypothetical protein
MFFTPHAFSKIFLTHYVLDFYVCIYLSCPMLPFLSSFYYVLLLYSLPASCITFCPLQYLYMLRTSIISLSGLLRSCFSLILPHVLLISGFSSSYIEHLFSLPETTKYFGVNLDVILVGAFLFFSTIQYTSSKEWG